MAEYVQIRCINKRPRQDPHMRISHVGGVNPNGTAWKLTEEDAIAGIRQDRWSFYVQVGGTRVDVIVATHNGNPYLKTRADGLHPDNLLALPECTSERGRRHGEESAVEIGRTRTASTVRADGPE